MDFSFLKDLYNPLVMVGSLSVGYILKHWIKDIDNKFIPTILAFVGAILSCLITESISPHQIITGCVTGLSATGLHQAFSQLVEGRYEDK